MGNKRSQSTPTKPSGYQPASAPESLPSTSRESTSERSTPSTEQVVIEFEERNYPRISGSYSIPPEVTPNDCEIYLRDVLKCRQVECVGSVEKSPAFKLVPPLMDNLKVVIKTYKFGSNLPTCFKGRLMKLKNEIEKYQVMEHHNIARYHSFFNLVWDKKTKEFFINRTIPYPPLTILNGQHLMSGIEQMKCSFHDYLKKTEIFTLDAENIKQTFDQIGSALSYLHDVHRIVHGDLSMLNICVANSRRLTLKLIDFEGAKTIANEDRTPFIGESRNFALLIAEYATIGVSELNLHESVYIGRFRLLVLDTVEFKKVLRILDNQLTISEAINL